MIYNPPATLHLALFTSCRPHRPRPPGDTEVSAVGTSTAVARSLRHPIPARLATQVLTR